MGNRIQRAQLFSFIGLAIGGLFSAPLTFADSCIQSDGPGAYMTSSNSTAGFQNACIPKATLNSTAAACCGSATNVVFKVYLNPATGNCAQTSAAREYFDCTAKTTPSPTTTPLPIKKSTLATSIVLPVVKASPSPTVIPVITGPTHAISLGNNGCIPSDGPASFMTSSNSTPNYGNACIDRTTLTSIATACCGSSKHPVFTTFLNPAVPNCPSSSAARGYYNCAGGSSCNASDGPGDYMAPAGSSPGFANTCIDKATLSNAAVACCGSMQKVIWKAYMNPATVACPNASFTAVEYFSCGVGGGNTPAIPPAATPVPTVSAHTQAVNTLISQIVSKENECKTIYSQACHDFQIGAGIDLTLYHQDDAQLGFCLVGVDHAITNYSQAVLPSYMALWNKLQTIATNEELSAALSQHPQSAILKDVPMDPACKPNGDTPDGNNEDNPTFDDGDGGRKASPKIKPKRNLDINSLSVKLK